MAPSLLRTGDLHDFFDHVVEHLALLCIRCFIVNLFSDPAADDKPPVSQRAQVVGDSRAGHAHHGGNIDHTFLTVAEKPENAHAGRVPQLLENL